jgi:hypothetical protein
MPARSERTVVSASVTAKIDATRTNITESYPHELSQGEALAFFDWDGKDWVLRPPALN